VDASERLTGEDAVMDRLATALVDYAHYARRVHALPSYSTARGPMNAKLRRLRGEMKEAMRAAWAFGPERPTRLWALAEKETGTHIFFSPSDLERP
jgi:hypothetical protein